MLETIKLSKNVVKIISDSNCYIVENKILIDTSSKQYSNELKKTIESIIPLSKIKKVIFTHLHYDHVGNFDLFPNAEFFANIDDEDFAANKLSYILDPYTAEKLNIKINNITENKELNAIFKIMKTPGHCKSCIVLHYEKDNIFFTGDTYFHEHSHGRVDLPTSEPEKIKHSLKKVQELIEKHNPKIAPGHDY